MKLAPGVHIIETSFWGRPLNLVLFRGHEVVLIDTGLVGIPQDAVCPALSSLDLTPKNLSLIVITHGHADHFGGNEELWLASERKIHFAAHRFDKDWIEDPASQSQRRYRHYVDLGLWTADGLAESIQASGNGVTLDSVLEGG